MFDIAFLHNSQNILERANSQNVSYSVLTKLDASCIDHYLNLIE